MSSLHATVELYRAAAAQTWSSLRGSLWAMAFLLAAFVAFALFAMLMAPFGMAGGFALGFAQAALIGWYLALLDVSVVSRRKIRLDDIKDTFGQYFWETISVLFLFFIARMLLQFSAPQLLLVVVPIAAIVFNPVPELIYQDRSQSTRALGDAARFMQNNWPEWLLPHLFAGALLVGWGWALSGTLDPAWLLRIVQFFGPFFEFILGGALALQLGGSGLVGVVSFLAVYLFVHVFMLFRGHLYRQLKSSSRRSRAWKARM